MAYDDLREWIAALDRAGELRRIPIEVDPILEITEITDRVSKQGTGGQPLSVVQSRAALDQQRRETPSSFLSST